VNGRGAFIVLEGVEGGGKSTQARLLVEWLEGVGISCELSREPGGTGVGEAIRGVLLDPAAAGMPDETELLLMLAARAAFVREVVTPAVESGKVMVADRFELSTLAYQGFGRGLGVDEVRSLNEFATGGVRPDLTIVLDLPVEAGIERQLREGKERDRIEAEGAGFLETVRRAYLALAGNDESVVVLDASPPPHEVHRQIRALLEGRFPEPFAAGRG
jgi:dTMP kinase